MAQPKNIQDAPTKEYEHIEKCIEWLENYLNIVQHSYPNINNLDINSEAGKFIADNITKILDNMTKIANNKGEKEPGKFMEKMAKSGQEIKKLSEKYEFLKTLTEHIDKSGLDSTETNNLNSLSARLNILLGQSNQSSNQSPENNPHSVTTRHRKFR
jgi:hypothetical protein